ncbi:MAG: squalene/phytoene synthase family protein [Sphingomonas fennica]
MAADPAAAPGVADPERALAVAYAPPAARPALTALWALDERLGTVVATTHEAMIGRIRLAWWREALERLDTADPPAEPLLASVAATILPRGVTGVDLAAIEGGWAALVDGAVPDAAAIAAHGAERGAPLFAAAAAILGDPGAGAPEAAALRAAGTGWVLADLGHRLRDPAARAEARRQAAAVLAAAPHRWPKAWRPLGALVALARSDASIETRAQGAPRRMARMAWHGLTGR